MIEWLNAIPYPPPWWTAALAALWAFFIGPEVLSTAKRWWLVAPSAIVSLVALVVLSGFLVGTLQQYVDARAARVIEMSGKS